jgi:hypothetical protein
MALLTTKTLKSSDFYDLVGALVVGAPLRSTIAVLNDQAALRAIRQVTAGIRAVLILRR